jgi:hypothetical protein
MTKKQLNDFLDSMWYNIKERDFQISFFYIFLEKFKYL